MHGLTLKSIPDDLLRRLRESARAHKRSLNREAIYRLEESMRGGRIDAGTFIAEMDTLRAGLRLPRLTDAVLRKARREGRP
jgi:hypothetical protein